MKTTVPSALRISSLCLLALSGLAQTSTLQGPAGGFLFDAPSRSLRPLIGLPGASHFGPPILTGVPLAGVAPDQRKAVLASETGLQVILDLRNPYASIQNLPGAIAAPSQILWAADSSSAVLFSASGKQLQFLWQDGGSVLAGPSCDLASLPSPVRLLAADPFARIAAVAAPAEEKSAVFLLREGSPPQLLGLFPSPVAAAFAPAGSSLYLAGASSLWRIADLSAPSAAEALWENAAELPEPVALAVSNNGQFLFLAGASSRRIRAYDLSAQRFLEDLEIDNLPSGFEPFTPTSFLLNPLREARDPVWILETSPAPRVIFIPSGE